MRLNTFVVTGSEKETGSVGLNFAIPINRAKIIVSTFEKANTGLVVIDGKLIEKPVLRDKYRILAIAEQNEKN